MGTGVKIGIAIEIDIATAVAIDIAMGRGSCKGQFHSSDQASFRVRLVLGSG